MSKRDRVLSTDTGTAKMLRMDVRDHRTFSNMIIGGKIFGTQRSLKAAKILSSLTPSLLLPYQTWASHISKAHISEEQAFCPDLEFSQPPELSRIQLDYEGPIVLNPRKPLPAFNRRIESYTLGLELGNDRAGATECLRQWIQRYGDSTVRLCLSLWNLSSKDIFFVDFSSIPTFRNLKSFRLEGTDLADASYANFCLLIDPESLVHVSLCPELDKARGTFFWKLANSLRSYTGFTVPRLRPEVEAQIRYLSVAQPESATELSYFSHLQSVNFDFYHTYASPAAIHRIFASLPPSLERLGIDVSTNAFYAEEEDQYDDVDLNWLLEPLSRLPKLDWLSLISLPGCGRTQNVTALAASPSLAFLYISAEETNEDIHNEVLLTFKLPQSLRLLQLGSWGSSLKLSIAQGAYPNLELLSLGAHNISLLDGIPEFSRDELPSLTRLILPSWTTDTPFHSDTLSISRLISYSR